jgi:hypothetical protein
MEKLLLAITDNGLSHNQFVEWSLKQSSFPSNFQYSDSLDTKAETTKTGSKMSKKKGQAQTILH